MSSLADPAGSVGRVDARARAVGSAASGSVLDIDAIGEVDEVVEALLRAARRAASWRRARDGGMLRGGGTTFGFGEFVAASVVLSKEAIAAAEAMA